jgi:membrane-associated phospholipid phosphatase
MHYKRLFNRARASMYSPALLPPITVPGHASYPSGHATEAYLMAHCLEKVMPAAARLPPPQQPSSPPPAPPVYRSPLMLMAQRIARNREVLGLHFPSDSEAGRHLAHQSFRLLMQCKTVKSIVNHAKKEWWP